jgi:hypothetical protein
MDSLAQRIASVRRASVAPQHVDKVDIAERRYQNDLHLKGTLDHIYEKYGRDFSEIGDEVDIRTGEVIVNRGHIQRMRGETDTGIGRHIGSQRSWINDLVEDRAGEMQDDDEDDEAEDETEDEEEDDEEDEDEEEDEEDELCIRVSPPTSATKARNASEEIVSSTEVLKIMILTLLSLAKLSRSWMRPMLPRTSRQKQATPQNWCPRWKAHSCLLNRVDSLLHSEQTAKEDLLRLMSSWSPSRTA